MVGTSPLLTAPEMNFQLVYFQLVYRRQVAHSMPTKTYLYTDAANADC